VPQSAIGSEKYSILVQNYGIITSPPIVLQNGTAGASTIYTNSTSAKVSTSASASTYDYVLRVVNQVPEAWKIRLNAYSQSNIECLNNCTMYFHNSTDGTSNQLSVINGSYTQQTGPWCDLGSLATVYIALAVQASDSQVSLIFVYLEVLTPNKTTYAQYTLTFEIT
jgi:hypothetical protein